MPDPGLMLIFFLSHSNEFLGVRTAAKEVGYLDSASVQIEKEFAKFGTDLLVMSRATGLRVPLVVSSCVR